MAIEGLYFLDLSGIFLRTRTPTPLAQLVDLVFQQAGQPLPDGARSSPSPDRWIVAAALRDPIVPAASGR